MMNFSVVKLQNQGGRPAIFWDKETTPKNGKKFSYKKKEQQFPIRKFPGDTHYIERDLENLTPDEPPPPPKHRKNFIKHNKDKVISKTGTAPAGTVTLTQEQLNAILRSVGKMASGVDNAVKISIGHSKRKDEMLVEESPRRRDHDDEEDDDDDYDDRREKVSRKKIGKKAEEPSIYSFLDKSTAKANSDGESRSSETSLELQQITKKHKCSKGRKQQDDKDEYYNNDTRDHRARKSKYNDEDDDDDDVVMDKNRYNKSKRDNLDVKNFNENDNYLDRKKTKNRSKNKQDDLDSAILELRQQKNRSKPSEDSDNESKDNRRRQIRSKRNDSDQENDIDSRERIIKSEKARRDNSKDTKHHKESHKIETNIHADSVTNDENIPSPRDKIGLPEDLSWRHMTKAERKRLEMARQKLFDDEEKKEEDRMKQLNAKYGLPPSEVKAIPQKYKPPRPDPAPHVTRPEIGRDTEISNYTDVNHRGHRSRSPSGRRTPEKSPDLPSYTTPDSSPKVPIGVPRRHMTLAEKKRLEWEKDRVESVQLDRGGNYDPWGRPGAGAPLRTKSGSILADYKGRKNQLQNETIHEDVTESMLNTGNNTKEQESRKQDNGKALQNQVAVQKPVIKPLDQQNIPHAMRSSFILGEAAPDYAQFNNVKEQERRQWLADLEKQIEEKRQKDAKQKGTADDNSWADKLGQSHHPIPITEQPMETVAKNGDINNTNGEQGGPMLPLESTKSQPENVLEDNQSYIRGQNAPIDPASKREMEDKRKKYLEHQAAVKSQVEEKENLKRMERERKMKEDMDEERKLQQERETLQKQFDLEQQKMRQKEQQRQTQVNQLKAAMDEAQAQALHEKYQRKMERLEAGGHDTSKLREHLEGEITSRIEQLHTRRERDVQRAQALIDLQYWGIPKSVEEEEEQQQQKKQEMTPAAKLTPRKEQHEGVNVIEPTLVPGLDLSTVRGNHPPPQMQHKPTAHREPYHEDRVLTPSQFRQPARPWTDPDSPRREFGTQTGDDLAKPSNKKYPREESDVNIEYRFEKGKRVRVISAPKEVLAKRSHRPKPNKIEPSLPPSHRNQVSAHDHHQHEVQKQREEALRKLEKRQQKGEVKSSSRPLWGHKNPDKKKHQKQSEKDIFYQEKKIESDERRLKREKQLFAMVERNKDVIPDHNAQRSSNHSPFSDIGIESPREVRDVKRSKSHSPNRQQMQGEADFINVHYETKNVKTSRRQHHQDHTQSQIPSNTHKELHHHDNTNSPDGTNANRNKSPPIPTLKRLHEYTTGSEENQRKGGKYGDVDPLDAPGHNGDFLPFTRTIDVLDPSKAEEPLPFSREATKVINARRAYYESLHPDQFGNRQYVFQDKHRIVMGNNGEKNPLMNPSLVLDHPTTRQDQILVQLSTLKQSLMQRQRELETFSPTDLVQQDAGVLQV